MTEQNSPSTEQHSPSDVNALAASPLETNSIKEEQEQLMEHANEEYQFLYWR